MVPTVQPDALDGVWKNTYMTASVWLLGQRILLSASSREDNGATVDRRQLVQNQDRQHIAAACKFEDKMEAKLLRQIAHSLIRVATVPEFLRHTQYFRGFQLGIIGECCPRLARVSASVTSALTPRVARTCTVL